MQDTLYKTKRKVVHVVQHLSLGGLENLTLDLLDFSQPSYEVIIISLEGNKRQAILNWPRLKKFSNQIIFLDKPLGISFRILIDLNKIFFYLKPDIVHTHHIGPLLYAGLAAHLLNIRVKIHTEHDVWHLDNYKHRQIQKYLLKICKPILVTNSNKAKKTLIEKFSYPNIITIKNGIDCKKFQPASKILARKKMGFPENKILIGSSGRLEKIKGHDLIIRAIPLLPKNIHLVIAGQGSQYKNLNNLVHKLNLNKQVTFTGLLNNMPCFYQSLDLFCLPSYLEGYPLSPLEAQACGIPCAISNVGSSKETLCPNNGQLIEANNILEITKVLKKMLNNPININPRNFILKNNNIRTIVKQYESLAWRA
ncbi:glycosyltransferase [Candidatus Photodesmus anomalopis]|uniref:Glycosyltransferase n=1 Tax=Candidatus Photodesmus katoptron Akat1 TaxID=1236703 RepID=S3DG59_9GAMM|nr:glycosyltransferase [Candidatus Photodesmus katoptron]EPE37402.1 glycosyltransferase [Candidatus Photodesmus katoptron Akat1]